ncbi:MAG: helix-turn-helix domain-containing protein [Acidimicrobiales bacterium]
MADEQPAKPAAFPGGPLVHVMPWGDVLEWQLPKLMALAGFRFATQLHGALAAEGIRLSYSQVQRLSYHAPERLTVEVEFALCRVLGCAVDQLWRHIGTAPTEQPTATKARQKLKTIKPVRARGLD